MDGGDGGSRGALGVAGWLRTLTVSTAVRGVRPNLRSATVQCERLHLIRIVLLRPHLEPRRIVCQRRRVKLYFPL